jgi:lipoprotein-releasing system permease protein
LKISFEHSIALRYLRGAESRSDGRRFLRFVTAISISGVAVGVCALIISLAIVRGFSSEIESKIIGFGAQVQIENFRDAPIAEAGRTARIIGSQQDVARIAPVIEEFVLLRAGGDRADGVSMSGVEQLPSYLVDNLISGDSELNLSTGGVLPMVVGSSLARRLSLREGDRVHTVSLRGTRSDNQVSGIPRLKQFQIIGIYETSLADFDNTFVYVPLEAARDLFSYGADHVTRYDLTLRDKANPDSVASWLAADLEFPVMARSVYEIQRSLFSWVSLQESIIPLIIGIIVLVAAFNIIGTLLMIILEKTGEIGVFASLGASRKSLQRIFLYLGLYIGIVGIAVGEIIAVAFSWAQLRYSIIPLPKEAYYMDAAPISMSPADFILVALITLILCGLSSFLPARIAARVQPVQAIKLR